MKKKKVEAKNDYDDGRVKEKLPVNETITSDTILIYLHLVLTQFRIAVVTKILKYLRLNMEMFHDNRLIANSSARLIHLKQ